MSKLCLLIMNPRDIPEVKESIDKNVSGMDVVWFRGFNSLQISEQLNLFVEKNADYDYYIVTSDDMMVDKNAIDLVAEHCIRYPVFTAYCNMHVGADTVNLAQKQLTLKNGSFPTLEDYEFMTRKEVENQPDIFETKLVGLSLTAFRKDVWEKYPFQEYVLYDRSGQPLKAVSSDHNFSYRWTSDGGKMYTHRDAFCYHLKDCPTRPYKRDWIVGLEEPSVVFEKH